MRSANSTKVLITGANGFIGKNLSQKLIEDGEYEILKFVRGDSYKYLSELLLNADLVVHLAGENRPKSPELFAEVNTDLTLKIAQLISSASIKIPILFTSSSQATLNNPYGKSKLDAENILKKLSDENGNPLSIYRLPGIFGKWCRPNYNSVVATFCNNIANDLPINIIDNEAILHLVHVDSVIHSMANIIKEPKMGINYISIEDEYEIKVGELANQILSFKEMRSSIKVERVGVGLIRALYSTYISYLPTSAFSYILPSHNDERGVFVEMLKTQDSGQFSFFTAKPNVTRGSHYHHTKTEKFLVLQGKARFNFRQILTNEIYAIETSGEQPEVVETIPGWAHDITNIGSDDLIVMLWSNELFDKERPDTISCEV